MEALQQAGNILVGQFFVFANAQHPSDASEDGPTIALRISAKEYNVSVESLELSSRTLNCLKRASLDKVGQILELKRADLLQIRNFGEKSLAELYDRLRGNDLLPPEMDPDIEQEAPED